MSGDLTGSMFTEEDDDEIAYFTVRWKTSSFVYRTKNMN